MSSSAAAVGAGACGHANCGGHGCKKHLGKRITEGYCLPYTPPQVPTSTFYQYWRTNACNVNVWDGFRNRCPSHIDMSINKKHGCMHGKCGDAYQSGAAACGDCGPPPSEWLRGGADCDSCQ
jgi:hypothetical protein